MSEFRERLAKATEELNGDPSLARDTSPEAFKQVISDTISFIAGIDFQVSMDSKLVTPTYITVLSVWLAAGAVEGAGPVMRVLKNHGRLDRETLELMLAAGMDPKYLADGYAAGILDSKVLAEGWKSSLPLDYLTAL